VVIKGDINNDGDVNLEDAITALRVISTDSTTGIPPDYVTSDADMNGDSKIGMEEVIYILQKVSGIR